MFTPDCHVNGAMASNVRVRLLVCLTTSHGNSNSRCLFVHVIEKSSSTLMCGQRGVTELFRVLCLNEASSCLAIQLPVAGVLGLCRPTLALIDRAGLGLIA
jgi:hypothetical protein